MKKRNWKLSLGLFALSIAGLNSSYSAENPVFSITHLVPTPYTLPAGRFAYGTSLAYGVTDFLSLSTDLIRDFYLIFNASAKVSFVDLPEFAFSGTFGINYYNPKNIRSSNPDLWILDYQPGFVTAFALGEDMAVFVGGNFNFSSVHLNPDTLATSGFLRGYQGNVDYSWMYNPPGKSGRPGNAVSVGTSYDFTYKIFGFGASHHWPGFQVGLHYYPEATVNRLQPILMGGGSMQF
jgi:hypothetical protein